MCACGGVESLVTSDKRYAACRGHLTALELLKEACPSGVAIDAGAFPGSLTRLLAAQWNVIALDKDPHRGLTVQRSYQAGLPAADEETFDTAMRRLGVQTLRADLETERWPISDGAADAVVLTEVLEHLYVDPLHALAEANRALKPHGVLLISTPNLLSIRNRMNFLLGHMARVIQPPFLAFLQRSRLGHFGHVRLYAPNELSEMLLLLGFEASFRFFQFDFWEIGPAQGLQPGSAGKTRPPRFRSLARMLFRSPGSYARAVVATARVVLERLVPEFRPHMYVIARKSRGVTMAELTVNEFESRRTAL